MVTKNRIVPKNIHFDTLNPYIKINDSKFCYSDQNVDLSVHDGEFFTAINSFGFTGTNVHLILKNYSPQKRQEKVNQKNFILTLAAKREKDKVNMASQLISYIDKSDNALSDIINNINLIQKDFPYRFVLEFQSKTELLTALRGGLKFTEIIAKKPVILILPISIEHKDVKKIKSNLYDRFEFYKNIFDECLHELSIKLGEKVSIETLEEKEDTKIKEFLYVYHIIHSLKCWNISAWNTMP